jgi:4-hydroxy-tetrahydrodipicolinate synthase
VIDRRESQVINRKSQMERMMRTRFTGVGTALVTPFRSDGSVDEAAVKRLARRQIDGGVHFLVPCGTTGESPTLTDQEKLRVCELVVEEGNGAVPVLAGCGGYDTREVIRAAGELERVGVDGFLSVTPYYNKPTQEGLYQHYKAFAQSTPLPIVLYSIQGRTGINLNPDTVLRLAAVNNIVGIKEASGNIVQMSEIVSQAPDDFLLLSGDDPLTVPIMAIGGRGVISVVSNEAPSEMAQLVEMCERGDYAAGRKLQHWLLPLIQVNFVESNPAPCKVAMAAMGLMEEHVRLPLVTPSPASRDRIMNVLQQLKMLGAAARI